MKKTFVQTKYKLRELWEKISELEGRIDDYFNQLNTANESLSNAWEVLAAPKPIEDITEINVKQYLMELDTNGQIAKDSNNNRKMSPLYDETNETSLLSWDEDLLKFKVGTIASDVRITVTSTSIIEGQVVYITFTIANISDVDFNSTSLVWVSLNTGENHWYNVSKILGGETENFEAFIHYSSYLPTDIHIQLDVSNVLLLVDRKQLGIHATI